MIQIVPDQQERPPLLFVLNRRLYRLSPLWGEHWVVRQGTIEYIIETNNEINFENYSTQELSSLLVNFYADARKKNGEKYKLSALKSKRLGNTLCRTKT
jgi:hypothetical protein